jgi:hypothetical protein
MAVTRLVPETRTVDGMIAWPLGSRPLAIVFRQLILVQTEQVSVFGVQIVDWNCCSAG